MLPFESTELLAFIGLTILRLGVPLLIIILLSIVAQRIEQLQP
jgi:hypothetical protein